MQLTMQELAAFRDQRLGFRARNISPDSVIFTTDSNFSIFSSNSASVDRCSFASDIPDQGSCVSDISQHLAGHELREGSASTSRGGPYSDPDPHKLTVHNRNSGSHLCTRKQKEKVQKLESSEVETEDGNSIIDSARNSFPQALKECQNKRSRSNAARKKPDRQRPASLDLENSVINAANSSSPNRIMKKNSEMIRQTGTFPNPGTPNYRQTSIGIQKGWSSERVPLHNNANRRHVSTALMPCNNGRTLPSKWEDAERWILSPISVYGPVRHSVQQSQRLTKSKSGPLGPPGIAYHSMYSPAVPMFEGGNVGNQIANSPFSAGVMEAHGSSLQCGENFPVSVESCIPRSVSVHGCSELIIQSSLPGYPDEKHDGLEHSATNVAGTVSRRDMATQMSPKSSTHSSPRHESLFFPSSPILLRSIQSSKPEVRDVQVDERIMVTMWSKKNRTRVPGRGSGNADDWKKKAVEIRSSSWDVSDTAKTTSKLKREEAKITAWENLQKAKAEAAIRKLEMKLEKKRSSSMDKIMNKLRSAQKKAQEMRSSVLSNQSPQVARTSHKAISGPRTRQIGFFSGCFTCRAC